MNSCLYECLVMHNRLEPRKSRFYYKNIMFYLNLDEIDLIARKRWFFSRNKFNIFNFRDADHLKNDETANHESIKDRIVARFEENGIAVGSQRIMLLTNVCTFGYLFNPVSFYFLMDEYSDPVCAIVEIKNKIGEQRNYFIGRENLRGHRFFLDTPKFYGSPFISNNVNVHFNLEVPGKLFSIKIDDQNVEGRRMFISTMMGKKCKLNALNLLWFAIVFPFVTLRMVTLLRWHSIKLMFKIIISPNSFGNQDVQRETYKPYRP
ncbi:DUF1365 domain-containing protein [Solitalea lacus]|uniref:DUF1365 domain-containing protein n=1 Tax=Solitalea lacus TaxID=2911172 RepID=UPI001EDA8F99|nr:DUF1365 domain-containing protein [Solitalea lacus]UKJ07767.1 DUF1365 domain-containing protein [Solitalea lacus]